jgi:hypothetical protein
MRSVDSRKISLIYQWFYSTQIRVWRLIYIYCTKNLINVYMVQIGLNISILIQKPPLRKIKFYIHKQVICGTITAQQTLRALTSRLANIATWAALTLLNYLAQTHWLGGTCQSHTRGFIRYFYMRHPMSRYTKMVYLQSFSYFQTYFALSDVLQRGN